MSNPNMREYFANYGLVWFLENRIESSWQSRKWSIQKIPWNPQTNGCRRWLMNFPVRIQDSIKWVSYQFSWCNHVGNECLKPLVNVYITMGNISMFNGKNNELSMAMFNSKLLVCQCLMSWIWAGRIYWSPMLQDSNDPLTSLRRKKNWSQCVHGIYLPNNIRAWLFHG